MTTGQAPEFDLPWLSGGHTGLRDLLASGPALLAFYKGTCPTCQLTLPFLERLHRSTSADAPRVITISQDDAPAAAKFNRNYGITFATLLDTRGYPASNAYKITNVPTLFLVEQDGRISLSVAGFDKSAMEKLGTRFGVEIFTADDRVPVFRPG